MNINNRHFYRELDGIESFSEIADIRRYHALPDDWLVIATDIRGSTKAIASGNYRAVNIAGACAIAAIMNEFPELDIPFVFGGDGVMIVMPDAGRDHVMGLLKYCKQAVESSFGLELAAGCLPMSVLREQGADIKIGKYILSEHINQAIFWGDGVDYIEEFIKKPEHNLSDTQRIEGDFSGLECRWNEIPSEKDEVVSVIIKSIIEDDIERSCLYRRCFKEIEQIFGDESEYMPIREERLNLSASPKFLMGEATIRSYPATLAKKMLYIFKTCYLQLAGWYLMKNKVSTKHTEWGDYKSDFVKNADFRKFSDGLKLVLSGTIDQRVRLRAFLEKQHQKGNLVFGTHSSHASMTTCLVTDYQKNHVHFIDGTNGGYASASVELKEQLKQFKEQNQKQKAHTV